MYVQIIVSEFKIWFNRMRLLWLKTKIIIFFIKVNGIMKYVYKNRIFNSVQNNLFAMIAKNGLNC